jgi:hypothetical protein
MERGELAVAAVGNETTDERRDACSTHGEEMGNPCAVTRNSGQLRQSAHIVFVQSSLTAVFQCICSFDCSALSLSSLQIHTRYASA